MRVNLITVECPEIRTYAADPCHQWRATGTGFPGQQRELLLSAQHQGQSGCLGVGMFGWAPFEEETR